MSVGLPGRSSMEIEFSCWGWRERKSNWMPWNVPHSPFHLWSLPVQDSLLWLSSLSCLPWCFYVHFSNVGQILFLTDVNCSPISSWAHPLPSLSSSCTSAAMWAATRGPGNKCWCVSGLWSRRPVAGPLQMAHQRGSCPRYHSGPFGHLLWPCVWERCTSACM